MAIDVREQEIKRIYSNNSPWEWEFLFTHCTTHRTEERSHTYLVSYAELGTELKKYECSEDLFTLLNTGVGKVMTIGFNQGMYEGLIITRIR